MIDNGDLYKLCAVKKHLSLRCYLCSYVWKPTTKSKCIKCPKCRKSIPKCKDILVTTVLNYKKKRKNY